MPMGFSTAELRQRLAHVRWIGGGTAGGKSTVAALLAARYDLDVYDGDRGERGYVMRARPDRQPRLTALLARTPRQRWLDRPPEQVFAEMPSLHGETVRLACQSARQGAAGGRLSHLASGVAPLLSRPGQAVFLLPAASFRAQALRRRYQDPGRAQANWGDADPQEMLPARLARDELWDAEVRRQAQEFCLPVVEVDGTRSPDDLAADLARNFLLEPVDGGQLSPGLRP